MSEDQQEILDLLKEGTRNQRLKDVGGLSTQKDETWTSFEFNGQKYELPMEKWNRFIMLIKNQK